MTARLAVSLLVQPGFGSGEYAAFVHAAGALQADLIWVNSYSMILRDDLLARRGWEESISMRGCKPI